MTFFSQDENGNGFVDYIKTYTYDVNGNLTSETKDYNGNGIVDFFYNGDTENPPSIDYLYTYTYDAKGNLLTRQSISFNSDGIAD
ncbi:hypothetical protein, partial [Nostoc sp. CHAB 5715]|uniref:hypothetical protein n=1 Tax=Nostoc sp. CHAB 5715 TaxID=2780400 RepID=UPI001E3CB5E3